MKLEKVIIIAILIILLAFITFNFSRTQKYDEYLSIDPYYVLDSAGFQRSEYITELKNLKDLDPWTRGDALLIQSRMGSGSYREACNNYALFIPENEEQRAIMYETMASINCYGNRKDYLERAAADWRAVNVTWRAELLKDLAENKKPELIFDKTEVSPVLDLSGAERITIGNSSIVIENNSIVITQTDRVFRDWLSNQLASPFKSKILKTFSERKTLSKDELREGIGWHEGGRLLDISSYIYLSHKTATGTIIAKSGEKWYAPDENGVFRFEVPLDKVSYPTTRFLSNDIAMIIDTHGINMIVEQAVRNNAKTVIGCCDSPGKIKAALYLSEKGISTICFTDLELYSALGHNSKILGSPNINYSNDRVILGNRPVDIKKNQTVVVTKAVEGKYAIWYYSAPYFYFSEINKTFPIDIVTAEISDFNEAYKIYEKAEEKNATIVAARIFNYFDYAYAKAWLLEKRNNKIILFHSTAYPYGLLLTQEFPEQTSFDDPNPATG